MLMICLYCLFGLKGLDLSLILMKKEQLEKKIHATQGVFFVRKIQGGSVNDLFKFIVNFSLNMFEICY